MNRIITFESWNTETLQDTGIREQMTFERALRLNNDLFMLRDVHQWAVSINPKIIAKAKQLKKEPTP